MHSLRGLIVVFLCLREVRFAPIRRRGRHQDTACQELPETFLSEVLGPAFNSRYMSILPPSENNDIEMQPQGGHTYKRTATSEIEFYVEEDFDRELSDEPAWDLRNHYTLSRQNVESFRRKRSSSTSKISHQWSCESKVSWTDLGVDYFPRYLRSVECLAKICWYGHFKCKPRSFTVKLLRRRDRCTSAKPGTKVGIAGLPGELRDLWVWEERAVNFCCDCAL